MIFVVLSLTLAALIGVAAFSIYRLGRKTSVVEAQKEEIVEANKNNEARNALDKEFNLLTPVDVVDRMRNKIEPD